MSPLPPRLRLCSRPPSRRLFVIGAGAAVTGIAAWLGATQGEVHEAPPAARPALSVTLEPPQTQQWEQGIAAHGAIEPWQELIVGARSSNLALAEVLVDVGDKVRRGALLARFDAARPRAEAVRLEAVLAQARANARHAASIRERMEALAASGAVSRQDLQAAQNQAAITEAEVRVVQAQLAAQQIVLTDADVRAPDDGVVSARLATPGAVAGAGQELFRIIRRHRLEWRAELTPAQLQRVRAGQQVVLDLPGGGTARATVRQEAPRLDARTRLATVYADIAPHSPAKAGMFAGGRILLGASPAVTVGAHSVVVRDGRSLVFVAGAAPATDVARAVPVTVGRRAGARSEIVSPLPRGVMIVGQGAAFLRDGDQVRVIGKGPQS